MLFFSSAPWFSVFRNTKVWRIGSLDLVGEDWTVSIQTVVLVLSCNGNARPTVVAVVLIVSFTSVAFIHNTEEEPRAAAEGKKRSTKNQIEDLCILSIVISPNQRFAVIAHVISF